MNRVSEIRWAIDIAKWRPSGSEWAQALSLVQDRERQRICRFVFKRDAKASLVGQLMLHKLIRETLQISNEEVILERTEKGKPYLPKLALPFHFNVSHQGAYTVVAASPSHWVGVDVMRIDSDRFEGELKVGDFFHTMRRQFTAGEWTNIRQGDWKRQLQHFFRHWCLKESYVKAVGVGIGMDLLSLDFSVGEFDLTKIATSTKLKINGQLDDDWRFEEQLLDDDHCVCVALKPANNDPEPFKLLTVEDLLLPDPPVLAEYDQWAKDFETKEEEPVLPWRS